MGAFSSLIVLGRVHLAGRWMKYRRKASIFFRNVTLTHNIARKSWSSFPRQEANGLISRVGRETGNSLIYRGRGSGCQTERPLDLEWTFPTASGLRRLCGAVRRNSRRFLELPPWEFRC